MYNSFFVGTDIKEEHFYRKQYLRTDYYKVKIKIKIKMKIKNSEIHFNFYTYIHNT